MVLHSSQDDVQSPNGAQNMGSFVEHDALGSVCHRSIRYFCARWHALFGERFQNLRRPDDRNMGSLTNPEDLLLNFRHSLKATLDRKVATGNHHPATWQLHGGKQHVWQALECPTGFDLQDYRGRTSSQSCEAFLEQFHILHRIGEGEFNDIGVLNNKGQVFEILIGQRRLPVVTLRKVDPLVSSQFPTAQSGLGDPNQNPFGLYPFDNTTNLAVVEPNRLSWANGIQHLRNGATNEAWGGYLACGGSYGRSAWLHVPHEVEQVPMLERNHILSRRKIPDKPFSLTRLMLATENDAGGNVSGFGCLHPATSARYINDNKSSLGVAGIRELDPITWSEVSQPRVRYGNACVSP